GRHQRVREAWVALALAQQRQLRLEQQSGTGEQPDLERRLVVVGEVPAGAEQVVQRNLEVVLIPVGEVRDLRVEQRPCGGGPHAPLRTDGERVARRLQVGRDSARYLDVVQHELGEHGSRSPSLEVETEKAV